MESFVGGVICGGNINGSLAFATFCKLTHKKNKTFSEGKAPLKEHSFTS